MRLSPTIKKGQPGFIPDTESGQTCSALVDGIFGCTLRKGHLEAYHIAHGINTMLAIDGIIPSCYQDGRYVGVVKDSSVECTCVTLLNGHWPGCPLEGR